MTISAEWIGWLVLAVTLVGAGVAVSAHLAARSRAATRRDLQRLFEQLDLCVGELHGLAESQASLLAALAELRGRLEAGQRTPAVTPAPAAARSYDIALRLARNGSSREELMAHCGMSRHEAELAVRLHGPASRGAGARVAAAG